MSNWYYASGGRQWGPVRMRDLKRLAEAGIIAPSDLVWNVGLSDWIEARDVKGIFSRSSYTVSTVSTPPPIPHHHSPGERPRELSSLPKGTSTALANVRGVNEKSTTFHVQRLGILLCGIIGMVATFLPWLHAPLVGSVNGTVGDGWATLTLFIPAVVLSFIGDRLHPLRGASRLGAALPTVPASLLAILNITHVRLSNQHKLLGTTIREAAHIGIGPFLVVLTSVAIVALALTFWTTAPHGHGHRHWSI